MFSNLLQRLRLEAEKVSPTNAQLLARFHERDKSEIHRRASGDRLQSAVERTSAGFGVGGMLGLVGFGMAQASASTVAAGVSASGIELALASAGTALGHLGTVAIAGAALPAAPIIALGVAAAGAAGLLISKMMPTSEERGRDATLFAEQYLSAVTARNPDGHDDKIGVLAWLKGAKNLVVQGVRDFVRGHSTSTEAPEEKVTPRDFLQAMADVDADDARERTPAMRGG